MIVGAFLLDPFVGEALGPAGLVVAVDHGIDAGFPAGIGGELADEAARAQGCAIDADERRGLERRDHRGHQPGLGFLDRLGCSYAVLVLAVDGQRKGGAVVEVLAPAQGLPTPEGLDDGAVVELYLGLGPDWSNLIAKKLFYERIALELVLDGTEPFHGSFVSLAEDDAVMKAAQAGLHDDGL